ncbi:ATP-binding protein [Streptomyces gramineus]|uniref:ATP-binding protein n=1 Tax=Streptomyces gramineus TaxID=910542 RepID=UPI00398A7D0B
MAAEQGPPTRLGSAGELLEESVMSISRHVNHFVVPVGNASVPQARNLARATLAEWGFASGTRLADSIAVIVSELVTNSVVHAAEAASNVRVTLRLWDGRLTVEVYDDHPQRPRLCSARAADEHGRGLHIIHSLATEWDGRVELRTSPGRPGKAVVVMLDSEGTSAKRERPAEDRVAVLV